MDQPRIITNRLQNHAEIMLFGEISNFDNGVSSAAFVSELNDLKRDYDDIELVINCVGGNVYEGVTIYNAIKQSPQVKRSRIEGIAASFGALLAFSTPTNSISKYGRLMTHMASGFAYGNAEEMRKRMEELEAIDVDQASMIATRLGVSVEEARTKYIGSTDRFFTAQEAKAEGLVDSIYDAEPVEIPTTAKTGKEMHRYYQAAIMDNLNIDNKQTIILL